MAGFTDLWSRRRGGDGGFDASGVAFVPVALADRERFIVLGLQWHAVLGADLAGQARRKARAVAATHWVHAGGRAESVGTVRLPRRFSFGGTRVPREAYSGAQVFAQGMPQGVHVLVLRLPDARYWMAVVRDGQVVGQGDEVLETAEAAVEALRAVRERFGGSARWLGEAGALLAGQGDLASESPETPSVGIDWQGLAQSASPASQLQSARGNTPVFSPMVLTCAAFLLCVAGFQSYWVWRSRSPAPPLPESVAEVDATHAWHDVMRDFAAGNALATHDGLQKLWRTLGALPLDPAGWQLSEVLCRELQGGTWRCEAGYGRGSRFASSKGLAALAPNNANVRWRGLDDAVVGFTVDVAASPLRLPTLAPTTGLIADADALQVVRPLFQSLQVGEARQTRVAAPIDEHGRPIARPPDVPELAERPVTLQGPLRSFLLIGPTLTERIAWREFSLRRQAVHTASTFDSALMATLQGTSYEIRR